MAREKSADRLEGGVRDLVHKLAAALEAGDGEAAAACWKLPAMVLSNTRQEVLGSCQQAVAYCQQAITALRERGPGTLKVRIEAVETLGPCLAAVEVVWSTPDATDQQTVRYLATEREDGVLAFCMEMPARGRPSASAAGEPTLTGALDATFPASDPLAVTTSVTPGGPDRRGSK